MLGNPVCERRRPVFERLEPPPPPPTRAPKRKATVDANQNEISPFIEQNYPMEYDVDKLGIILNIISIVTII